MVPKRGSAHLGRSTAYHGASRIWQVPDLADVHTMLDLLSSVGAHVERSDECVYVEASQLTPHVPYELARMMRASFF